MTDEELRDEFAKINRRIDSLRKLIKDSMAEQRETRVKLTPDQQEMVRVAWELSPKISRARAKSKRAVWQEWQKIPRSEWPTKQEMVDALKAWKACHEWQRDGGQAIPGLQRLVRLRFWEDPPERQKIVGIGNAPKKREEQPQNPGDFASGEEAADFLRSINE